MDCSACGARTPEGAKFCTWCGASLAPPATVSPGAVARPGAGGLGESQAEDARAAPEVFVGRQAEWGTLQQVFARAEGGRPQFALISGDPGMGKSALAGRLLAFAREAGARVVAARPAVHVGEGGGNLVRALLFELVGADPAQNPVDLRTHVSRELAASAPDDDRLADLLCHLLGLAPRDGQLSGLEPRSLRQTAWKAMSDWLAAQAAETPLVISLSDLQRADEGSLEWLDALCWHLGHAERCRILIVGQYRTGALDPLPGIDSPIDLTNIALRPLAAEDARILASALLGAGREAEPLAARAVAKAEGNPFFLTQLILAAAGNPDAPLPDSIRATVASRLDDLAPERRDVLDIAAVAGRRFDPSVVADVAGRDVERDLADLLAGRFLRSRPDRRIEFAQTLVQETAHELLSPARRADLHRRVGLAVEARLGARAAIPLAHHFAEAGEPPRAATYGWLAGCQARSAYAFGAARQHLEAALCWLDRAEPGAKGLPDRAEILLLLSGIARGLGDYGRAVACLDERARLAPETAASLRARGEALYRKGELAQALASFERAGDFKEAEPAEAALARAGAANVLRLKGDLRGAAALADEARATLEGLGRSADAAFASSVAGICFYRTGRYREALAVHDGALRLREGAGDLEGMARSHSNLGITHAALGDRQEAHAHHTKALAVFRKLGDRRSVSQTLTNLGDLLLGDPDAPAESLDLAARHFEEALKIARKLEDSDTAIADLGSLAELAVRRGDAPTALGAVDECLALMGSSGHGEHAAAIQATRGRALRLAGDAAGARDALETARRLAETAGNSGLAELLGLELADLAPVGG